jgi:hypothetical protein
MRFLCAGNVAVRRGFEGVRRSLFAFRMAVREAFRLQDAGESDGAIDFRWFTRPPAKV